jgi:hypothetical protein
MADFQPITPEAVAAVVRARTEGVQAAQVALATALRIPISMDGAYVVIAPRDSVLVELFFDAFEAAREAKCTNKKIAFYIEAHQRLVAALIAGVATGIMSRSSPVLTADSAGFGVRSPSPLFSLSAAAIDTHVVFQDALTTMPEAADTFETLMRSHTATSFTDPEGASSRYTLTELQALVKYEWRSV